MTLNTEGNGTQTSSRLSISENSRSMRMLVTTHVCHTLKCKHMLFTTSVCIHLSLIWFGAMKGSRCTHKYTLIHKVVFTRFILFVNREVSKTSSEPRCHHASLLAANRERLHHHELLRQTCREYIHTQTQGLHLISWGSAHSPYCNSVHVCSKVHCEIILKSVQTGWADMNFYSV